MNWKSTWAPALLGCLEEKTPIIFSFSLSVIELGFFLESPTSRIRFSYLSKNLRPHKQCSCPLQETEWISTLWIWGWSNGSLNFFRTQSESKSDWSPFLNLNPHRQLLNQISSSSRLSISTNWFWSSLGKRLSSPRPQNNWCQASVLK